MSVWERGQRERAIRKRGGGAASAFCIGRVAFYSMCSVFYFRHDFPKTSSDGFCFIGVFAVSLFKVIYDCHSYDFKILTLLKFYHYYKIFSLFIFY